MEIASSLSAKQMHCQPRTTNPYKTSVLKWQAFEKELYSESGVQINILTAGISAVI